MLPGAPDLPVRGFQISYPVMGWLNRNMPGFSFLVTLLAGVGAWSVRSLSKSVIAGGLVVGGVLTATSRAADTRWLLGLGVFTASVFLGALVGRIVPPRPALMALLLGVLSVSDIIWINSGGGSATGSMNEVLNFSVQVGNSSSSIGTLDLVLAAAVAAHWLRRGARTWLAVVAAPIGMVLSNVYVAVSGVDNLPLVPFIALGWLATEFWHGRFSGIQTRTRHEGG